MTSHDPSQPLKRSPLHEEHIALGARMVPFAGWEMPVQYSGIIDEHNACRSSVGIFDVSHMAEFRVFGRDAEAFLSRMLTNDLSKIAEIGEAQYSLLLNEDGGIIDDLIVYRTGDIEFMIIANASNREKDFAWLQAHLPETGEVCEGVPTLELIDESDKVALIAVQGPSALDIVTELAGEGYEAPDRFHIEGALLDTIPTMVARTGYTGEDGVEIVCPVAAAPALWRALLSFAEVTPVGLGARDTLRLEMGYSLYGNDMDETIDPISAGLGWVVRKTGGFIGSDAVARIREKGVTKKLVALRLAEGTGVPRPGYPVLHNGEEVGIVASGSFSPTLGYGIATAYVPVELASLGQELEVRIRKNTASATVVKPPFVTTTSLS